MTDLSWLGSGFWMAMLIGILVLADVYLLLERAIGFPSLQSRRAGGIFAGAAGMLITLFLLQNPTFLRDLATQLVVGLAGLLLATIALIRRQT